MNWFCFSTDHVAVRFSKFPRTLSSTRIKWLPGFYRKLTNRCDFRTYNVKLDKQDLRLQHFHFNIVLSSISHPIRLCTSESKTNVSWGSKTFSNVLWYIFHFHESNGENFCTDQWAPPIQRCKGVYCTSHMKQYINIYPHWGWNGFRYVTKLRIKSIYVQRWKADVNSPKIFKASKKSTPRHCVYIPTGVEKPPYKHFKLHVQRHLLINTDKTVPAR